MKNADVCKFVEQFFDEDYMYVADKCVKARFGQTCGGYLSRVNNDCDFIKQKQHFLNYYGKDEKIKKYSPTYQYLRCPQLLLFIAEILGVSKKRIDKAYKLLINYELKNRLYKTDKSGNYLWGNKDKF